MDLDLSCVTLSKMTILDDHGEWGTWENLLEKVGFRGNGRGAGGVFLIGTVSASDLTIGLSGAHLDLRVWALILWKKRIS